MKNIIVGFFIGLGLIVTGAAFMSPAHALAQFTVPQGGTGSTSIGLGRIPFGQGGSLPGSLRLGVDQLFRYSTSTQTLNVPNLTITGTCTGCSAFEFPFTNTTNYGQSVNATGTPIWFQAGLMASSTSHFNNASTSQFTAGLASTSALSATTLSVGGSATTSISAAGIVTVGNFTSALALAGSGGAITGYAGSSCGANTFASSISAVGAVTCGTPAGQFPFTMATNFGVTMAATTTSLWAQSGAGLFASSTSVLASTTLESTGKVGVASSTPFAYLSVNPTSLFNGSPSFAVGSSTFTNFIITSNGRVGIATTSPWAALTLDRNPAAGAPLASSSIVVTEYRPATSTSATIDCRTSNQHKWRIGGSATTLTLTGMVAGQKCIVVVENPAGTAGAITWAVSPGILLWAGGTTPTQTTTANKQDVWSFLATQGSTTMAILGAMTAGF